MSVVSMPEGEPLKNRFSSADKDMNSATCEETTAKGRKTGGARFRMQAREAGKGRGGGEKGRGRGGGIL